MYFARLIITDQKTAITGRSVTSIDLQAAQRAKARTQYATLARQKIASGTASLRKYYKSCHYYLLTHLYFWVEASFLV